MAIYGSDLWCLDDISPNAKVLREDDPLVVAQAIYRRIISPKGSLATNSDYGLGLVEMLSRGIPYNRMHTVASVVKAEILKDDRVSECTVESTVDQDSIRLKIWVTLEGDKEFEMVISGGDSAVIIERISVA